MTTLDSDIEHPNHHSAPSPSLPHASPRNNGPSFYSWSTLLFEDPRGWKDPRSFQHGVSPGGEQHQHSGLQFAQHSRTKKSFYRPDKLARMRNAWCREWKVNLYYTLSPATGETDHAFD